MDADGTKDGYDLELTAAVSTSIRIPVLRQVVLCLIAIGVVLLGCDPNLLLHWL